MLTRANSPRSDFRDRRRNEFLVLRHVAQDSRASRSVRRMMRQPCPAPLDSFQRLFGNDQDAIVAAVVGQFDAETVENTTAKRRHQARADAVLLGPGGNCSPSRIWSW